jgi:hypothetical protein
MTPANVTTPANIIICMITFLVGVLLTLACFATPFAYFFKIGFGWLLIFSGIVLFANMLVTLDKKERQESYWQVYPTYLFVTTKFLAIVTFFVGVLALGIYLLV